MTVLAQNSLANLVFVLVALLAWAVKTALERREARRRPTSGPTPSRPTPVARRADEIDVVYGQRPIAPEMTPAAGGAPASAGEALTGGPSPTAAPAPAPAGGRFGRLAAGRIDSEVATGRQFVDVQAPLHRRLRGRARAGVARLGVAPGRRASDMARAGVLWSEVLGPPRALAGPHRPPALRRPLP